MWTILLMSLAAAPLEVDPARKPLETCAISGVSFRTPDDAWLFDHCGRIFRSSDGGDGWVRVPAIEKAILGADVKTDGMRHLNRLTWLTPKIGLAFPYDQTFAARTDDAGATWKPVKAAIEGYVYAVEAVGSHVWICDSSGKVKMSPDQGVTWQPKRRIFDASDIIMSEKPTSWCSSLSFLDARHGWALGWRTLWQTSDGGATWTALQAPPVSKEGRLDALMRVSPMVAWVESEGHRFVTIDGGKTWNEKPRARSTSVHVRADGRPALAASENSADWEPSLQAPEDELDSRPALTLALVEKLAAIRDRPVLPPKSSQRVALTHIAGAAPNRWGAAGRSIFRQGDGDWFLVTELKNPVKRLAALESGSWLAETSDGLFKDGRPADSGDRMDWERLTNSTDGGTSTQRSLQCLQTGEGWLELRWEAQGCFGGDSSFVRMTLGAKAARVESSATSEGGADRVNGARPLSLARTWIQQVESAATRPELVSSCRSTTKHEVTLKWQCQSHSSQELHFSTYACGRQMVGGGEARSFSGRDVGYARALALAEVAESLFAASDAGVK